jgi:hypothetical protein
VLRAPLAIQTLVRISDGSVGGRGGGALMIPVGYNGRALPLAWVGRRGKKGPVPEDLQLALIAQVQALIPPGAQGVRLGDGEGDGTDLQHTLPEAGGPPWSGRGATSP